MNYYTINTGVQKRGGLRAAVEDDSRRLSAALFSEMDQSSMTNFALSPVTVAHTLAVLHTGILSYIL